MILRHHVEPLAKELFIWTHAVWSKEEIEKYWEDPLVSKADRAAYTFLAERAIAYLERVFLKL